MDRLDALVAASWQGALLGFIVFAICRLFPRIPARFRAMLWWAVCLKMVCVAVGAFVLPLPLLPAPKTSLGALSELPPTIQGSPATFTIDPTPATSALTAPAPVDFSLWIVSLWVAGIVALLAYIVVHAVRLRRLLKRATPAPQGPIAQEARRLGAELGLSRKPEVLLSEEVSAPMVVRPWRPAIILPASFAEVAQPAEATMALAHELAHVRRGDLWLAIVPAAAQALLWFHPLAWLAAREWATERESACDAEALAATGGSPADYGRLLIKIVGNDHQAPLTPVLGATSAYHTLKRRLELMKNYVPMPNRTVRLGGATFAIAALLAALPWQVVAQPPAPVQEKNLIVNPSFESGLANWDRREMVSGRPMRITASIDTKVAHSGKSSLKYEKTENSYNPVLAMNQEIPTSGATRRLKVGMWVKAEKAYKATMAVILDEAKIEWGAYVGDSTGNGDPADHDWKYYNSVVDVPAGTSNINIGIQMYGPGTVWIDDVSAAFVPSNTPLKKAVAESGEDPLADVKDVPNEERKAGNDPLKRYFLIGKPAAGANKLVVVMPGGDGGPDFNPFMRRVWKNALPTGYLMAQVVAPQWSDDQKNAIVWPTKKVRWTGMKFSTEELIEAVIKDVSAKNSVDPSKVFVLAWSSGGPAAYATTMASPSVKGALVAMSVYNPESLPAPSMARGRAFYLLQSPDDRVTTYGHALTAQKELTGGGAKVELATYKGGHGWLDDPFGNIRKGMEWLEANAK